MISVIMPYMHSVERLPLLMETIKALPNEVEICVLEIGKKQYLDWGKKYKHKFVKYDSDINHRALALNIGVRELSTGSKLVLLDADVIVSSIWFEEVKKCDYPAVAWGRMHYLTKESTQIFIDDKLLEHADKTKTPRLDGPSGGITVIDRKIFYEIKGVPENFEGTWGGPDNTLFAKLRAFGYPFKHLNCDVLHLYHSKNTPRNLGIALFAREMLRWSKKDWDIELKKIGDNWGKV